MARCAQRVVAALVAGALLAGCGGGGSSHSATTATTKPLTKAQATELAHALNLRAADVPGFASVKPERESREESEFGNRLAACAGAAGHEHRIVDVKSAEFKRSGSGIASQMVQSDVTVESSPAYAQQDLRAIRSTRGEQCVARALDTFFKGKNFSGASIGNASVSEGTPPGGGTGEGFALRIVLPISASGLSVTVYVDFLGFVQGPAEVMLMSFGLPEPFPAAEQQRLYKLLEQRASARGI